MPNLRKGHKVENLSGGVTVGNVLERMICVILAYDLWL